MLYLLIIAEHFPQGFSARAKRRYVFVSHARRFRGLVSLRETLQLLVVADKMSFLVLQRHAETSQLFPRFFARFSGIVQALVQPGDKPFKRLVAGSTQGQCGGQPLRLLRREVEAFRETSKFLP